MGRATAAIAGVVGLSFGTGAFTETTAERDFTLSIADDETSQLVIEPSEDLDSDAVEIDDGELRIDTGGLSPSATATLGEFDQVDIDDPDSIETPLFVIRNENELGGNDEHDGAVDIEAALSIAFPDEDTRVGVFLSAPDETGGSITDEQVLEAGEDAPAAAAVEGVPSSVDGETDDADAEIQCGLIVESAGSGTLDGTGENGLEITATKSNGGGSG